MYPILYEANETQFTSNGLGRMTDASSCFVHEVRNGEYELVMEYPASGIHADDIKEFRILYATHDMSGEAEPFDIYKITKPNRGVIEVHAHHVSYRTNKIIAIPSSAIGSTVQDLFDLLSQTALGSNPFTLYSDVSTVGDLVQKNFASIRSYLYNKDETGIIECFGFNGGEYKLRHWNINFLASRGNDNGVKFRSGKNVRQLYSETDNSDVITAVVPYWLGKDPVTGDNKYVDLSDSGYIVQASNYQNYPYQMCKPLDLSGVYEQPPTEQELEDAALEWLDRHNHNTINHETWVVNVADNPTDFDEHTIQNVNLCDTVTVEDVEHNRRIKLKVSETTYNVLKDRYDSIVVGDPLETITETFTRQNSIYIQQINNLKEQVSATSKLASYNGTESHVEGQLLDPTSELAKKTKVEQVVTSGTEIAKVGGTSIYASGGGSSSGVYWQETSDKGYRHYGTRKPVASADAWKRRKVLSLLETDYGAKEVDWGYYDYINDEWVKVDNIQSSSSLDNFNYPELIVGQNDYLQQVITRIFGQMVFCTSINTNDGTFPGFIFQRPPVLIDVATQQEKTEGAKDPIPANWRNGQIPHMCLYIDCRSDPTQRQGAVTEMIPSYFSPPSKIRLVIAYCDQDGFVATGNVPSYMLELPLIPYS